MNHSVIEVLEEAKAKISIPDCWTKGTFARDSNDLPVPYNAPEACKFCGSGAVKVVVLNRSAIQDEVNEDAIALLHNATRKLTDYESFVTFNDYHKTTLQEVLAVFDLAISIARSIVNEKNNACGQKPEEDDL